jgi:hypothetical protein
MYATLHLGYECHMHAPGFLHLPGGHKTPRRPSILAVDSEVGRPAEDTLADLGVRPPSDRMMALHATRQDEGALQAPASARRRTARRQLAAALLR